MAIKICLDAGHYAKYNRSPAVPAYYESEMNWKLHLKLKAQLEKYGIEVMLTREDQTKDLALTSRGNKSKGCDLFLSIHSNAVGGGVREDIDYPVVYVSINGKGDKLGNLLAKCVEQTMETKQAGQVQSRKGSGDWDYYSVIYGAVAVGTVGMIIEHSFHTNTRSTNWLLQDANLDKLAVAEAKVIAEYFGLTKQTEKPAQQEMYRIRKSWADAESQIGAYVNLDNAKKACPIGYSVFDSKGKAVYTKEAAASNPATNTSANVALPVLTKGSEGGSVKALQILLNGYGYKMESNGKTYGADGSFGDATLAAVKRYQSANGLDADGIVGAATWAKLLGM